MQASRIEVVCNVTSDLAMILGDPDQLQQVLINLLRSARQALENQPAPRHIAVAGRNVNAGVEITVADNGPGVPESLRSRLFDPFFTTKPTGTGSGVGLAVSRGVVEAHGGSLQFVQSAAGAQFVIRLPVTTGDIATVQETKPASVAPGAAAGRDGPARRVVCIGEGRTEA
jgi:two-component system NtrC family sensor kinase